MRPSVVMVTLVVAAVPVCAQGPGSDGRAWAVGVAAAEQARALQLFEDGNALFAESQHAPALARYRDAISHWDHPGIRYNMAVALIHLDQPLQAYENLELALRYGAAPFDKETHEQAQTYRKLLRHQLAELKVTCAEPGAEVLLDGEPIFKAPGEVTRRLLPSAHQLVATKSGYQTASRRLLLMPGDSTVENLQLTVLKLLPPETRRRWPNWKPWVVAAVGIGFAAAVGIPLELVAKSDADSYDAALQLQCPSGCKRSAVPAPVLDLRDRAGTESGVAIGAFAVGGATALVGVVLLILNRPRVVESARVTVAPLVAPDTAGATMVARF